MGSWEPSFTNSVPIEDVTKEVCDFLTAYIVDNPGLSALATGDAGKLPSNHGSIEIEARLGSIIDKQTGARLKCPVRCETVLDQGVDVAFESVMTMVRCNAALLEFFGANR